MQMWAVAITVALGEEHDDEALRAALSEHAVPSARDQPGFVSAIWTLDDARTKGVGVMVLADEASARARAAQFAVGDTSPGGTTISSVDLLQVLASA
jgi:hypothetical protein